MRRLISPLRVLGLALALGAAAWPAWADVNSGRELYGRFCVGCHGPDGSGVAPGTPNFRRDTVLLKPDSQIIGNIKSGRNGMPAFYGIISDRDLQFLVLYLRTLR